MTDKPEDERLLTPEEIMEERRKQGGMYQREYDLIEAGAKAQLDKVDKLAEEEIK